MLATVMMRRRSVFNILGGHIAPRSNYRRFPLLLTLLAILGLYRGIIRRKP